MPTAQQTTTASSGPSTLVQPLFVPQDHTRLLQVLHKNHAELLALLEPRDPAGPQADHVLRTLATLGTVDDRTRLTARQVLSFHRALADAPLPASYEAALGALDGALTAARAPTEVVQVLLGMREQSREAMPGFEVGVRMALELITDALETDGGGAFGASRPTAMATTCARSAVSGALRGALSGTGAMVGAVAWAIAGSAAAAVS
jgi:hypothetical protein